VKPSSLLKRGLECGAQFPVLAATSRFGHYVAHARLPSKPAGIAFQERGQTIMIGMGELPIGLCKVGRLIDDDTSHAKMGLADQPDQLTLEALIELRVAEPPKHASTIDQVLTMKADDRVVRMPIKDVPLEITERLGESFVRSIGVEPDPQKAQIAMIVVVGELERVVPGLVDI
jgi:hypothetical protein